MVFLQKMADFLEANAAKPQSQWPAAHERYQEELEGPLEEAIVRHAFDAEALLDRLQGPPSAAAAADPQAADMHLALRAFVAFAPFEALLRGAADDLAI